MSNPALASSAGALQVTPSPRTTIGKTAEEIARAGERAGRTFGKPGGVLAAVVLCVAMVVAGVVWTITTLDRNRPPQVVDYATKDYVDNKFAALQSETRDIKDDIRALHQTLLQVLSRGWSPGSQPTSGSEKPAPGR